MTRLAAFSAALSVCLLVCGLARAQQVRFESPTAQASHAAREAFEAVLQQPTKFEFTEVPLADAIEFLADKHDVEIQLDSKALSDLSLDPASTAVTRSISKPISLASALELILADLDMTHVVRDDVILITSAERAEELLSTKVYKVDDLLSGGSKGRATMAELIEAISATVRPDSWSDDGGPGTITPLGALLIVSQTRNGHSEMTALLAALRGEIQERGAARPAEEAPPAAQAHFTAGLWQPTELEFADTPLSDALEFLAKKHEIDIQLDHKALADLSLDPSQTTVTLSIRKPTPLRSALERMLEPLDLAWTPRHEVVWITSKPEAESSVTTKLYSVNDLLNRASGCKWSADDLALAITTSVQPDSWSEDGGPGAIARIGDILVVAQNREGHEKLGHLLTQLRAALPLESVEATPGAPETDSTDEHAVEALKIVAYRIHFLSGDEAAKALTALIAPESWQSDGGTGAVCTVVATAKPSSKDQQAQSQTLLVVRQTPTVHNQIRRLLGELDRSPAAGGGFGGGGGFF